MVVDCGLASHAFDIVPVGGGGGEGKGVQYLLLVPNKLMLQIQKLIVRASDSSEKAIESKTRPVISSLSYVLEEGFRMVGSGCRTL